MIFTIGYEPLNNTFSVFARAGGAHWWYHQHLVAPAGSVSLSQNANAFIWGAGASAYADGALLRLEYEQSKSSGNVDGLLPYDLRLRLISFSIVWMF
jgi:hypothetical protein